MLAPNTTLTGMLALSHTPSAMESQVGMNTGSLRMLKFR